MGIKYLRDSVKRNEGTRLLTRTRTPKAIKDTAKVIAPNFLGFIEYLL